MRFNSIEFLVFFPLISIAFFLVPHKYRWVLLLGASYFFYMSWRPKYIVVLLAMTGIGYLAGLWLARDKNSERRHVILVVGLAASSGILLFFKFFDFSSPVFESTLSRFGIPNFVSEYASLPLGISFFTLQVMSYMIDVYRGTAKVEKHMGIYALFVAFFPQLLAGPIGRANHLLPQYHQDHVPDYERIVSGLQRMVWGLFKKLVIADRLAVLVNTVYGSPTDYTGLPLIIATYAFGFQLYCDFSGYADIAIGAARIMGFQLAENFDRPYSSQSIPEFWRRWHITLSNWLRDYIFYPIQRAFMRRRVSKAILLTVPPMVTMLVSGLWHGESWNFIIWGALHGSFIAVAALWGQVKTSIRWPFTLPPRFVTGLKVFATFNLVSFTWIFFRSNTFSEAIYIVRHLFVNSRIQPSLLDLMPGGAYEWMIVILAILFIETVHIMKMKWGGLRQILRVQPVWLRWSIYFGLVIAIFLFGKFASTEFIYSRF